MNARPETPAAPATPDPHEIVVYSRPGCPFCFTLRAGLRRAGVAFREIDIWKNPDAAAFVRSVANGNETVPTVTVGRVNLVNPSVRQVHRLALPGMAKSYRWPWLRRSKDGGTT